MSANKFDKGKPPLSRLPKEALEEVAKVLAFGAAKYGWNNWKDGMEWSRLLDASLRHIYAFVDNTDLDPESGQSHLAHAICNLMFLIHYQENNIGTDDRSE